MNPKHQNPAFYREDSRGNTVEAVAPYNFVPLPEQVHAADLPESCNLDHYGKDGILTGYIDCSFTTQTPLYTRTAMTPQFYALWGERIRDLMKDPAARQSYAQFFHLKQGEPVIPGSSLRGMIRTIVEIISSSKMKWVTDEPLVFRSVGDRTGLGEYYRNRLMATAGNTLTPKMVAGYIEKVGHRWYIRPAQSIGGSTFARIHRNDLRQIERNLTRWHNCKNASNIWVQTGPLAPQNLQGGYRRLVYKPVTAASATAQNGYQAAVLARSGQMNNKRREAIFFPPDPDAKQIEIDETLIVRYREQLSQEQEKLLGTGGVLRHQQPVFYLLDDNGKLVFFGHAMMFRLPYEKTPRDFVPRHLRSPQVPDTTKERGEVEATDLAEAIFGFVVESKEDERSPRAGRVYFSDAKLSQGQANIWLTENPITPKIMSGPKATSFQHYLTQQEPDTVDTGDRTRGGEPKTATLLDHYASPPPHETVIRGHKLYWHKQNTGLAAIAEPEKVDFAGDEQQKPPKPADTQHTQIKPVRTGTSFQFRLHFENLRDFELGALLWAITLPGEAGKRYCHKLGMGKALGMGSIHLAVDALQLSDRKARYTTLFAGDQWCQPEANRGSTIEQCVDAFVTWVTGSTDTALHEDTRIRMLLKLLEFPGPNPERTRYMELGEFRERPVLPDPLHVGQRLGRGLAFPLTEITQREEQIMVTAYSDDTDQSPGQQSQALLAQLQARIAGEAVSTESTSTQSPDDTPEAKIPQSKDDFVRGAYIQVTVKEVQFNAVICETGVKDVRATLQVDRMIPPLEEDEELIERFATKQVLEAWVLSINRKGNAQLTLTKPE